MSEQGANFQPLPGNRLARGSGTNNRDKRREPKLRDQVKELLKVRKTNRNGNEVTVAQAILNAGVAAALNGDFQFWKYIIEMHDGPLERQAMPEAEGLTVVFNQVGPDGVVVKQVVNEAGGSTGNNDAS